MSNRFWLALAALALGAGAAPAVACPGDCSGDGAVAINELVTCVTGALGAEIDCIACDANGDGMVAINELVAAVNAALTACPPTPSPSPTVAPPSPTPSGTAPPTATGTPTATASATPTAADTATVTSTPSITRTASPTRTQRPPTRTATPSPTFALTEPGDVLRAAAEVAVQNLETVDVAELACVSVGACQIGSATVVAPSLGAPRVARGLPQACAGGGTKVETCDGGVRVLTFVGCVEPGAGASINRRDGEVVLTVQDPTYCTDLVIEPSASMLLELRDFRHLERDEEGAEVARLEADWIDTMLPLSGGCRLASPDVQLANGFHAVSGMLHVACRTGSVALPCPRAFVDVTLRTTGLDVERHTGGTPCELRRTLDGTVAVEDRDPALGGGTCRSEFTQTFTDFLLFTAPLGNDTTRVRLSGRLTVDRFGPLDFATRPRQGTGDSNAGIHFDGAADCPTGGEGELVVQPPDAAWTGTLRFQQSGGGDPEVVLDEAAIVAGCTGISELAVCE